VELIINGDAIILIVRNAGEYEGDSCRWLVYRVVAEEASIECKGFWCHVQWPTFVNECPNRHICMIGPDPESGCGGVTTVQTLKARRETNFLSVTSSCKRPGHYASRGRENR